MTKGDNVKAALSSLEEEAVSGHGAAKPAQAEHLDEMPSVPSRIPSNVSTS